jgi:hypothetical protein
VMLTLSNHGAITAVCVSAGQAITRNKPDTSNHGPITANHAISISAGQAITTQSRSNLGRPITLSPSSLEEGKQLVMVNISAKFIDIPEARRPTRKANT